MNWHKVVQELNVIATDAQTRLIDAEIAEHRIGLRMRYHTAEVLRAALLEGLERGETEK